MLDNLARPERPTRTVTPTCATLPQMFLERVKRSANDVAWKRRRDGRWVESSWRDAHAAAASVATWLMDRGIAPGDKLVIVGSTRAEWCVSDLAGLLAGAVTVGAYPTLAPEQLAYIVDHSDARVAIVEDAEQLAKLVAARAQLPRLERVLVWDAEGARELLAAHADWVVPFATALATAADTARVNERAASVEPANTAVIVYTSGTTGPPKGAMISHQNIVTLLSGTVIVDFDERDCALSFLPMAHVAERVLAFYGRIDHGIATAFASSVPAVLEEIKEVQPTIFGSVPRIFEKAYARIQREVEKAPPAKQRLFRWAESVGLRTVAHWQEGRPLPLPLKLQHAVADKLVFSRLRSVFGGRVRYFVTGAAPIPRRVLDFFWAAGFPIFEVYGMTEATVLTHANRPGAVRLGSVGKPISSVEERLADDGEILIRGKTVFQGYYKDPAATAEAIDSEGWLHTGDVGRRDADGYLYIVDRKKHIIITSGGKNLTPANIENEIKTQDPIISQVHAHGDRRPYVTAIVSLSPVEAIEWALAEGVLTDVDAAARMKLALMANPLAQPDGLDAVMKRATSHPALRRRVADAVRRGNARLSRVERVKRVHLLDREFSAEHDEITPTLKVKRKNVEARFAPVFDQLYADEAFGIVVAAGAGEA